MAIQPNHRRTHTPLFIFPPPYEDCWDSKKIDRELGLISGIEDPEPGEVVPWGSRDDHPVVQYRDGLSLFDIETIREYMLPGRKPTIVVMRWMSHPAWLELQSLRERETMVLAPVLDEQGQPKKDEVGLPVTQIVSVIGRAATLDHALRHVVVSIDDLGVKAGKQGLSDSQIEQLRSQLGDERFLLLEYAALASTRSLTAVESFH